MPNCRARQIGRLGVNNKFFFNRYRRGHAIFFSFFRRVRATSMNKRRVENTRVHFWTFSPVLVKSFLNHFFCF